MYQFQVVSDGYIIFFSFVELVNNTDFNFDDPDLNICLGMENC